MPSLPWLLIFQLTTAYIVLALGHMWLLLLSLETVDLLLNDRHEFNSYGPLSYALATNICGL
jgi:hypothetical protein